MRTEITHRQIKVLGIFNLHQIQAKWMRRYPAGAAHATFQHLTRPFNRTLTRTDGHQYASDIADHMMQKGIGTNIQHYQPAKGLQLQMVNRFDRRLGLTLARTKRTEIMGTYQLQGGAAHQFDI